MKPKTIAAFVVLLSGASFGQAPKPKAFEVASIRPIPESELVPSLFVFGSDHGGGQFKSTTTLYSLVRKAYDLPEWRIAGMKPEQSFYAIASTMDPSISEEEFRAMLQQLLKERFAFAAHFEIKELSGYAMVVGPNGSKLKTVTTSGQAPSMPEYLIGTPAANLEGRIRTSTEGTTTSTAITGRGVPTSKLADALSNFLAAPVQDRTGLAGNYYFGFQFAREDNPAVSSDVPSVFAAVQEELGLKLAKQNVPVEILVVDHVDRIPSEN